MNMAKIDHMTQKDKRRQQDAHNKSAEGAVQQSQCRSGRLSALSSQRSGEYRHQEQEDLTHGDHAIDDVSLVKRLHHADECHKDRHDTADKPCFYAVLPY
jgi:adenine-specific DNA methylase